MFLADVSWDLNRISFCKKSACSQQNSTSNDFGAVEIHEVDTILDSRSHRKFRLLKRSSSLVLMLAFYGKKAQEDRRSADGPTPKPTPFFSGGYRIIDLR